jgi:protein-L-isoaspartate(D-aspartate) O-methyltransferase
MPVAGDGFERARLRMVEQIAQRGVRDDRVLDAMRRIPRHRFLESGLQGRSYDASSLPIGQEQTISQPFIVAYMTEQLQVGRDCTVLEIGTGSGYQTAILALLAREVCTIELRQSLQEQARRTLRELRLANVRYRVGDGAAGWPEPLRFERIIVTAAGTELSSILLGQLEEGGRLVAPVGDAAGQQLMLGVKLQGRLRRRRLMDCDFVPLVTKRAD